MDIQWLYTGRSQEMIAVLARGNFLVVPSFSGRVEHVQTGGLYMEQVNVADTGNYTIEVTGHDPVGVLFTFRHTAVVRVGGECIVLRGLGVCVCVCVCGFRCSATIRNRGVHGKFDSLFQKKASWHRVAPGSA